jgi:hypothetical protein
MAVLCRYFKLVLVCYKIRKKSCIYKVKDSNKHDEEKDEILVYCCSQTVYKLAKDGGYWSR